jgi:hypothetical protein
VISPDFLFSLDDLVLVPHVTPLSFFFFEHGCTFGIFMIKHSRHANERYGGESHKLDEEKSHMH